MTGEQKRKYQWFAVEYSLGNERNGCDYFSWPSAQYAVKKGLSVENVRRSMSAHDDPTSEYAPCHWFGRIQGFPTKAAAVAFAAAWAVENEEQCKKMFLRRADHE